MTSNAPSPQSFSYIDCDIPAEQTLADWRRERDDARPAETRRRRIWPIAQLRSRWAP